MKDFSNYHRLEERKQKIDEMRNTVTVSPNILQEIMETLKRIEEKVDNLKTNEK